MTPVWHVFLSLFQSNRDKSRTLSSVPETEPLQKVEYGWAASDDEGRRWDPADHRNEYCNIPWSFEYDCLISFCSAYVICSDADKTYCKSPFSWQGAVVAVSIFVSTLINNMTLVRGKGGIMWCCWINNSQQLFTSCFYLRGYVVISILSSLSLKHSTKTTGRNQPNSVEACDMDRGRICSCQNYNATILHFLFM